MKEEEEEEDEDLEDCPLKILDNQGLSITIGVSPVPVPLDCVAAAPPLESLADFWLQKGNYIKFHEKRKRLHKTKLTTIKMILIPFFRYFECRLAATIFIPEANII